MGRVGAHVTLAIRGQPSLKAEPIRPFPGPLTNFATGPDEIADLDTMIGAIVDDLAPNLVARHSIGRAGAPCPFLPGEDDGRTHSILGGAEHDLRITLVGILGRPDDPGQVLALPVAPGELQIAGVIVPHPGRQVGRAGPHFTMTIRG